MRKFIIVLALLASASSAFSQETLTRLLRQPDIHGDTVAFVYAGDIWLAPVSGGDARRLTSGEGMEYFPKFSPDGRSIAFTGDYSGTRQVFVISVDGGQPKQLTFYNDVGPLPPRGGIDNRILDWTPDGKNILFLPHRLPWGDRMARPYTVPAAGGMEQPLAIPEAGGGMYSPDGTKLVYTPIEREFRTWKRYRGGRAQDVWIYDLAANTAEQITTSQYTDNQPLWIGNTIYFTSDREDGRLNLWSYDLGTKQTTKVTNHTDYDVLWPSADRSQAVYEAGGYLYRFANGQSTRIPIRVYGDFRGTLPYYRNVRDNIEWFVVSPTGQRALFSARGDVFSVPAKEGEIRNLTQTPGIRERDAVWSPDGRTVAYLSDRSGEYEIYVRPADGSGEERQVTKGSKAWRFAPRWSPDSKLLAFSDKDHALQVLDVASGKITVADNDPYGDITDYRWSPDSRWLTYTKGNAAQFSSIYVYNLANAKVHRLTSDMTHEANPVFDPKGRYLYFTSNRDFNLTFSSWEFNYLYTDPARVYVGVLAEDGPALFLPQSDEEKAAAQSAPSTPAPAKSDEKKSGALVVKIDPETFEQRVRAIPGAPGTYGLLEAINAGVIYAKGDDDPSLKLYDIENRKEETIIDGIRGYELSANGEKLLVQAGRNNFAIVDAKPGQKIGDNALKLDKMELRVDPKAEWTQEFTDAWRIFRDWFYDPDMHGVDWNAIREKYGQLVPHVSHRADLDYILGEVAGELNAGHAYVGSPADLNGKRVENGLLGAEIVADSGYFRIANIFPGENWHESFRSPLTEPGVKVREGDYILAVDGTSTKGVDNFYRLLENKADRAVTLLVNATPSTTGARTETVRPIRREHNLRYLEWVASRREYVAKASNGRIGYIHLPNTAQEGNRELVKSFYPQVDKEALIIDDRYNGGGFIPDRMIELLEREPLSYWARRNTAPMATPGYAHVGPKAMLINGYSSSGGDALPYYFRKKGLGTIIGTRTWGGLIGISGNPSLMDGGSVAAPQFRFFDTEGMWAVEGVGVSPDIEVVDRPDLVAKGQDPSLEMAVKVLLEQLEKNPVKKPAVPPMSVER
jgi:tricorn protease